VRVALTFDTEPPPPGGSIDVAAAILDALAERGVVATFFVQAEWADLYPELAARLTAEGHRVGNHTYSHALPGAISAEELREEIGRAEKVLEHRTGQSPHPYFRCPQNSGAFDAEVIARIEQMGYRQTGWTFDSFDWHEEATADGVLEAVRSGVDDHGDGAIVLLHTWPSATAEALPRLLDELLEQGVEFVTLDDIERDVIPQATAMPSELPFPDYKLGASAAWGMTARFLTVLANFLIGVIIARALGPAGKGAYALVVQIVGVLVVMLGLGLDTANIHFVARREVSARRATANSLWLLLLTGSVATVVCLLLISGPLAPEPAYPVSMSIAGAALFVFTTMFVWLGAVAVGLSGLKPRAIAGMASVTIVLSGAAVLWALDALTPLVLVAFGAVGQLVAVVVVLVQERGRMLAFVPSRSALRRMVSYSTRSYFVNLVRYLHLRVDILVLGWLTAAATVGVYSVAVSLAEVARYAPSVVSQAVFARASQLRPEDSSELSARMSRLTVVFVLGSALFFAVLTPLLVSVTFGASFAGAVPLLYVLLPGVVFMSVAEVPSSYLFSQGVIYWRASAVILVLNVVINLIAVPQIGAMGAALASTTTYSLYMAVIIFLARRTSGLPYSDFLVPTGDDVRLALSALGRYARR
jgi:O-antigen/teichoic acid export membrane protein/peptidoglycan/xylan/chitin deacetylase (PgdA/CDA1 family)